APSPITGWCSCCGRWGTRPCPCWTRRPPQIPDRQHPGLNAGISRERPGALQRFYREPGFTGLNASPEGLLTAEEAEPTHPGRGGKGWPRPVGTYRGTFLPAGPAARAGPARGAVPAAVATAVPLAVPMPVGSPGE